MQSVIKQKYSQACLLSLYRATFTRLSVPVSPVGMWSYSAGWRGVDCYCRISRLAAGPVSFPCRLIIFWLLGLHGYVICFGHDMTTEGGWRETTRSNKPLSHITLLKFLDRKLATFSFGVARLYWITRSELQKTGCLPACTGPQINSLR